MKASAVLMLLLAPAALMAAETLPAGTKFKIVSFSADDPLKDDEAMIGLDCVVEGSGGLTRYSGMPYHYGLATCGDSPKLVELLSVKIELLDPAAKLPPPTTGAPIKPLATATATAKPVATAKPTATATPIAKATATPTPAPTRVAMREQLVQVSPGTRFTILEFADTDPLRESSNLVGTECVADGFLLKYQKTPFYYGQAKCGADATPYDLLGVRIQLVEKAP